MISAWVFITKGPYWAMGSSSGRPCSELPSKARSPLAPLVPYATSKLMAEERLRAAGALPLAGAPLYAAVKFGDPALLMGVDATQSRICAWAARCGNLELIRWLRDPTARSDGSVCPWNRMGCLARSQGETRAWIAAQPD